MMRAFAVALLLACVACAGGAPRDESCWCPDPGAGCWRLRGIAEDLAKPSPAGLAAREDRARQEAEIWRLALVPWERALGVSAEPLAPEESVALGIPPAHGFRIRELEPRGPAAMAGFALGDCFLRLNGKAVSAAGASFMVLRAGPAVLEGRRPGRGRIESSVKVPRERLEPAVSAPPDVQEMLQRALREAVGSEAVIPTGRQGGGN